jgi:hypothetical protein
MTRLSCLVAVACVALCACSRSAPVSENRPAGGTETGASPAAATPEVAVADYLVAAPIQHENLTIFPILSKTPRLEDRFVTLDEGLKAGTVEIVEKGARVPAPQNRQGDQQTAAGNSEPSEKADEEAVEGAVTGISEQLIAGNDVNRLTVINRGTKPLYLMPGEIIVGGSQDRTIAEETVVAATGEPVDLEVYCVEHGRWGMRDAATNHAVLYLLAADSDADGILAAEANEGKFVAKAGTLSKSSRLAVQGAEGQQKVWDEVKEANGALNLNWSSGAFTANYVDPNVVERLKPYIDALSSRVSDDERVVGIVVAINGKIETVDVFESTPLFRKLWPQLLKSFALDALHANDSEDAKKVSTPREAEAFLASVLHDQKGEDRKTDGGLVVSRHETKDAVSFSAGGMGMMGGAAPIHASGYAK